MAGEIAALLQLSKDLRRPVPLPEILQRLVDVTATLVGSTSVSLRVLDETGTRLVAISRAGQPLHLSPTEFHLGEGLIGWIAAQGEPIRSGDAQGDPRFAPRPGMRERMGSFLGAPLFMRGACRGVLSAISPRPNDFSPGDQQIFELVANLAAPYVESAWRAWLERVDPVTGALTRAGFEAAFPQISLVSLALVGVDRAADDAALRTIASVFADSLRAGDTLVRWDEGTFAVVYPATLLREAADVADMTRVQAVVESEVPLSAGVVERRTDETRDACAGRAASALEKARAGGGDRMFVAE